MEVCMSNPLLPPAVQAALEYVERNRQELQGVPEEALLTLAGFVKQTTALLCKLGNFPEEPLDHQAARSLFQQLRHGSPFVGEVFTHYKTGHVYAVTGKSVFEPLQVPLVTYQGLHDGCPWSRPLANFQQVLNIDGKGVPRFRQVGELHNGQEEFTT
jgi:hypothetical protein